MLLNAEQIVKSVITDKQSLGASAQVGYDCTLKEVKVIGSSDSEVAVVTKNGKNIPKYLTLEPSKIPFDPENIDQGHFKGWILSPGIYSITFDQGVKLSEFQTAWIVQRSTLLRCGIEIKSSIYDPGFEVENCGAVMIAHKPIVIECNARVAQIIVLENYPAEKYDGQYNKDKDIK